MTDFYIGIASYKRAGNQRTLAYLEEMGVAREKIAMSVQTMDDLLEYEKAGIRKRVGELLYREAKNASGNRNTLLDYFPAGARVLLLDDDITTISRLQKGELKPVATLDEFERMVGTGFALAAKHHTAGFGVYPVHNAFFMSEQYKDKNIVDATLIGVVNTRIRFNEALDTKEDFEYCCAVIRKYGAFIRMNNYACKAQHHSKGGCEEVWKDRAAAERVAELLCAKYPDIVRPNPRRKGEILMTTTKKKGKAK